MPSTGEMLYRVLVGTPMDTLLKELRRMAGEVKNIRSLKGTMEELSSVAHSTVQQFRADAGNLLETLKFVKEFGREIKQIDGEMRALFAAETNGGPTEPGAS
jgi:hypothetical protein